MRSRNQLLSRRTTVKSTEYTTHGPKSSLSKSVSTLPKVGEQGRLLTSTMRNQLKNPFATVTKGLDTTIMMTKSARKILSFRKSQVLKLKE